MSHVRMYVQSNGVNLRICPPHDGSPFAHVSQLSDKGDDDADT